MKKFLKIFSISFQQEFAYKVNFIMWRVRNVMQIFLVFFLWSSVFTDSGRQVFGYDRARILTYVFGILVMKAFVFSSRTVDVAGEIANGDITNYLLKPISYFKYWFTRDIASKALNLSFAVFEVAFLFILLRPNLILQTNPTVLLAFILSLAIAIGLYFFLLFLVNLVAFWTPESGWAAQFLFMVIIVEFLSGGFFPIDILPSAVQRVLYATPFPYLLFFPLQIYLGKLTTTQIINGTVVSGVWLAILVWLLVQVWHRGIRRYSAEGR